MPRVPNAYRTSPAHLLAGTSDVFALFWWGACDFAICCLCAYAQHACHHLYTAHYQLTATFSPAPSGAFSRHAF